MSDLSLTPAFTYYYVAHDVWGQVSGQIQSNATRQLQYVPAGSSVYSTAGIAGTWLGKNGKTLTRLVIVGHGSPGRFFLGEEITSDNIAALGGWLYSFFESDSAGIQILGCNSAADSTTVIGKYEYGQANPLSDTSLSHKGHELLQALAKASEQKVEGALHGQAVAGLRLRGMCRRVYPDGRFKIFDAGGT
ncbi:MAG: hypothetical protein FIA97_18075 [Methylococcaceae bacterium]|nr:hypothetical protein [Methylococcaceae bacterium]